MVLEEVTGNDARDGVLSSLEDVDELLASNGNLSNNPTSVLDPTSQPTSPGTTSRWNSGTDTSSYFQPAAFTAPHRSIFSSGLPTSSLSVNAVHASMSAPSTSSTVHPLSTLTGPSTTSTRRSQDKGKAVPRRRRSHRVQKHADDPSIAMVDSGLLGRSSTRPTSVAVSNLFGATDGVSRTTSFIQPPTISPPYTRTTSESTMGVLSHLYMRGLMDGRHSDIKVHCFGKSYALHRILLDRAPYFYSGLSEPWFESTAKEITLHPEETDSSITQAAFELALKRIYGCADLEEEAKHAISLFATGCWLEMTDLIETSISLILTQMNPENLAECILFVTKNYYGKYGERIEMAARAMLCREGYEMLLKNWLGIPGDIVKDIICSDAFYVPGEWERWVLARKLFDRRVKSKAIELNLADSGCVIQVPRPKMSAEAMRAQALLDVNLETEDDRWLHVYADPDIVSWYELFDQGIHYVHMSFEQLQQVKKQMDVFKIVQIVPEKVLSAALWQSITLRQKIINADDQDPELGFTENVTDEDGSLVTVSDVDDSDEEEASGNPELRAAVEQAYYESRLNKNETEAKGFKAESEGSQKYWIPLADSTYSMGRAHEDTTVKNKTKRTRLPDGETIESTVWATDMLEDGTPSLGNCPSPPLLYSRYPPFRFAAEFPPAKSLKENKRVYSNTVWYAGSLWNVYIQKKETSKNTQLGIYLHREKQVGSTNEALGNAAQNSNVNERINSMERELYLRQRSRRGLNRATGETSDFYSDLLRTRIPPDLDTISGLIRPRSAVHKSDGNTNQERPLNTTGAFSEDEAVDERAKVKNPALSPYVDSRSTIKTYFRIYAPSRCGRTITVYESAPDQFNFSQSWGWKSSNLVIDDLQSQSEEGSHREPRLRFMIVIGNV